MNPSSNHPSFYPPVSLIMEETEAPELFDTYLLVDYSFFKDSKGQKRMGIRANLRVVDNRDIPVAYSVIPKMVELVEKANLPSSEHFFNTLWPEILKQLEWERIKSGPSDDPGYAWTPKFSNNKGLFGYAVKDLEVGIWALEKEDGRMKKLTKKQEAREILKELVSGSLQYKTLARLPANGRPPTLVLAPVLKNLKNWSDNKRNGYNLSFVVVLHIPDIESFRFYEDRLTKSYLVKVKAKVSGYFLTISVSNTHSEIYANGNLSPSSGFSDVKSLSATRRSKWGLTVGLVNQELASEYLGQRYIVRTGNPWSEYEVYEEGEGEGKDPAWECTVGLTSWGNVGAQQEARPEASEVERYRLEVVEVIKKAFREMHSYQENLDAVSERFLLCLGIEREGSGRGVRGISPIGSDAILAYQQASFMKAIRTALSASRNIKNIPFADLSGRFLEGLVNRAIFSFETIQVPPLSSVFYNSSRCHLNIGVEYRTFALINGKMYISGGGFHIEPKIPILSQRVVAHEERLVFSNL